MILWGGSEMAQPKAKSNDPLDLRLLHLSRYLVNPIPAALPQNLSISLKRPRRGHNSSSSVSAPKLPSDVNWADR